MSVTEGTGDATTGEFEALVADRERDLIDMLDVLHRFDRDGTLASTSIRAVLDRLEHSLEERQVAEEELRAQQHQLEEALLAVSAERHRYRELFEAAPVSYLVTDAGGMIRDANRAAGELFGASPSELVGKPLVNRVREPERQHLRTWLTELSTSRRARSLPLALLNGDGEAVDVVTTVVRADGRARDGTNLRWILLPRSHEDRDVRPGETGLAPSIRARLRRPLSVGVGHPSTVYRRELGDLLRRVFEGEARIVSEQDDVGGCVEAVRRGDVDVAVVAVRDDDDIAQLDRLKGYLHEVRLVAIAEPDDGACVRLLEAGAHAVIPTDAAPEAVIGPLVAAMDGWTTIPPFVRDGIVEREVVRRRLLDGLRAEDVGLLRALARGASDAEMAAARSVSQRTVKRRLSRLYRKLGVTSRTGAAAVAGRAGLLDDEQAPSPRHSGDEPSE